MTRVVVVQETVPHYRVPFFEDLRDALAASGVTLEVVTSRAAGLAAARRDEGMIGFAKFVPTRRFGPFVWQSALRQVRGADLVVVEQANRQLLGHLLRVARRFGGPPVALWGHGANLQRSPDALRERVKRRMTARADWFFAYTEGSAARAEQSGVPHGRITVVQNAVRTRCWDGTPKQPFDCVYVGGLYDAKRLDFLLAAADSIAEALPQFRLHIVGDGPRRDVVTSGSRPYLRYHGVLTGAARDEVMHRAQLTLMPGLVGLVILDAFAAAAPLVTVAASTHSPEIEYLVPGTNGAQLHDGATAREYADEVLRLLSGPGETATLRAGCAQAAKMYTLEAMVQRFTSGLLQALSATGPRAAGAESDSELVAS